MITLEKLDSELRKHNLHLYDFGDGITQMPVVSNEGYLTTQVFYVVRNLPEGKFKALGVQLPYTHIMAKRADSYVVFDEALIERLVAAFETQAKETTEGEVFPVRIKISDLEAAIAPGASGTD